MSISIKKSKVVVIGAGLAGSECAWFLANQGVEVVLIEKKRLKLNPAQKTQLFAELVCTNSLKSTELTSAHGLLKKEMLALNSLVLSAADQAKVPAGDALAVDREVFSGIITQKLIDHPLITLIDEEAEDPRTYLERFAAEAVVVATGPLTGEKLEQWMSQELGEGNCYFYDAIAPVVDADSLNYEKLYFKNRHEEPAESADYLNAPMTKEQYYHFIEELNLAEKVKPKNFESEKFFESCLPIDVMAERGIDTPRFSCMKPIGLSMGDHRPYAVVQLRKENLLGAAFNLVGFQTRLTYPEQKRVFRLIPGFEQAEFIHLGSVHRNTYLNSAKILNFDLSCIKFPNIYLAGQIIGVEGYTESAAMGQYVALQIARKLKNLAIKPFPVSLCLGALINYIQTWERPSPSNINFGLLPTVTLEKGKKYPDKKRARKEIAIQNALREHELFLLPYLKETQDKELN
jgi:methylenetetrahydrofolate--tRNA-(uracil-5-)-methyltransferase